MLTTNDGTPVKLPDEALSYVQEYEVQRKLTEEQDLCEHDELDHGYCLDCGKDCLDDLIGRAELNEE